MAGKGHEDAFAWPRTNGRCQFSQGSFAGTCGNRRCASELVEPCAETTWRARTEFLRGGTNSSNPSLSSGESANHRFRRRFRGLDVRGSRPRTRVSTGEMGSLHRWRPSLLGLLVDLVGLIQIFSRGDAG